MLFAIHPSLERRTRQATDFSSGFKPVPSLTTNLTHQQEIIFPSLDLSFFICKIKGLDYILSEAFQLKSSGILVPKTLSPADLAHRVSVNIKMIVLSVPVGSVADEFVVKSPMPRYLKPHKSEVSSTVTYIQPREQGYWNPLQPIASRQAWRASASLAGRTSEKVVDLSHY